MKTETETVTIRTSMKTVVVHCKEEPYDVYIGRPSEFGNPFSHKSTALATKVNTRKEAIESYKKWINGEIEVDGHTPPTMQKILALTGKILGCWCKPKQCHGDILAEICNEYEEKIAERHPEAVAKLKTWMGEQGVTFFRKVLLQHGRVDAVWMVGDEDDPNKTDFANAIDRAQGRGIPHPVHFREGMQVRNFLRTIFGDAWTAHDYDNRWTKFVERAIE